ncbi:MAG: permease [Endomicrobiales bacterium]|nr:permease [Endomicrobiales bacterium]
MAKDPICDMDVDEKTGLKAEVNGQTYYFCSRHCMNKFLAENKAQAPAQAGPECPHCAPAAGTSFYKNKTFIVTVVLALLSGASYYMPLLVPFRASLFAYFNMIWWAVLLGLVLGGVIDRFVPREYVSHVLAKKSRMSIINAVLLGFLMSACSHGILALSIQLHKKGASNPAVVAFLLASPWANLPLAIMLLGFFGLKALYIIISAIVVALITGFVFQVLEKKGMIETNKNTADAKEGFSVGADIARRWRTYRVSASGLKDDLKGIFEGAVSLGDMVVWWILIGMGIASAAGAYIPSHIFTSYMGPTFLGLLVTLALATVIEVCSEGSAPMAFELFKQTGAFGNSFVFLMAGVATDYTEIGLLWHNVGRKTAVWLPIVSVPQIIVLGYIANLLFK